MALTTAASADAFDRMTGLARPAADSRPPSGAVSWGAVIAGAAAAASLSLILLVLGVGLGLSSVSPWSREGVSAATFGVSTVVWLTLTQLLASGMGGYLAGRLRNRWTDAQGDEVFFRDTAHGFLAWAVSSLATAALLTSVIGSIVGGGVQASAAMAVAIPGAAGAGAGGVLPSPARMRDAGNGVTAYLVDSLFRRDAAAPVPAGATEEGLGSSDRRGQDASDDAAEVSRILQNAGDSEALPPEDARHVARIVARRTGMSQPDAEQRVQLLRARAQSKARQAEVAVRDSADKARKASAYSALWLFVSLLAGAFIASLAATFGGRRRDA